jgi:hypothetical protein
LPGQEQHFTCKYWVARLHGRQVSAKCHLDVTLYGPLINTFASVLNASRPKLASPELAPPQYNADLMVKEPTSGPIPDGRPIYLLWVYDARTDRLYIDHNENKHPAHHVTHDELAPHANQTRCVRGFAYSIKGGWRITDDEHDQVEDRNAVGAVLAALRDLYP